MDTQFFKQIDELNLPGQWCITVQPGDQMVVSIVYRQPCGDKAAKVLPAFNLRGTPAEIDAILMERIRQPFTQTAEVLTNMENYMKELEATRLRSQQEKDRKAKEKSTATDKDKKYNEAMQAVGKLEEERKYREAIGKLPKPADYPEKVDAIEALRSKLMALIEPDLFSN